MKEPKPPFNNLEDAREKALRFSNDVERNNYILENNLWPCWLCEGSGKRYDPQDYDIYEGYKLAHKVACFNCKGVGTVPKEVFMKHYEHYMAPYREELKKYITLSLKVEKVFKKLAKEDIKLLKEWWGVNDYN